MDTAPITERKRVDAQRNRARILEVAYPAFSENPNTSLNLIAKLAGVGPGTLYRHFPTREDLLLAVYQDEVAKLVASVKDMLQQSDPLDAFRMWVRRLAAHARMKDGLGDALTGAAAQSVISATWGPVSGAIARLLAAAAERGDVREGIDPNDVVLLLSCLWRVPPGEAGLIQADRLLEMIIGSLATDGPCTCRQSSPSAPARS